MMKIQDAVVLVTGANRGIGLAFCKELLARGTKKVYAGVRNPQAVALDGVVAVGLDVTRPAEVAKLAHELTDVSLVINNAGILEPGSPLDINGLASLRKHLESNFFGVYSVSHAFAPSLIAHQGGMLNVISVGSWLAHPAVGNYAISKAALWGLTNNLRAVLAPQGVTVTSLHMGYVDTDMTRTLDVPKSQPEDIVRIALDGLANGLSEIIADSATEQVKQGLSTDKAAYLGGL